MKLKISSYTNYLSDLMLLFFTAHIYLYVHRIDDYYKRVELRLIGFHSVD